MLVGTYSDASQKDVVNVKFLNFAEVMVLGKYVSVPHGCGWICNQAGW